MPGVRLLLIANPKAQTVSRAQVTVIERALSTEFDVELQHTKRMGHARHLAQGAAHEGLDLVVAMGGDGTINEVANGLAETPVPMGIIPGGGTNVLARSLGIPIDPVEATGALLANVGRPHHRVPLGRADGRFFTFACGIGLDGAIVRKVERRQLMKRTVGQGYFVWSGLSTFFFRYDRRRPKVHVRWGEDLEHRRDGLFLAISQKTSPFTYLGDREMRICPGASLEGGIDLFATDSMRAWYIIRIALQMFGSARHVRSRHAFYLHDQPRVEVTTDRPLPVEMDGEYVGERTSLLIEAVPDALSLVY